MSRLHAGGSVAAGAWSGRHAYASAGFTLVEVMIALLLGLLLVGGALTVFLSNRETYRVSENVGRVQESSRVAFELMSRDLREAGGNPCELGINQFNLLKNAGAAWWSPPGFTAVAGQTFFQGFDGAAAAPGVAFGTADGERLAGTDAVQMLAGVSNGIMVRAHDEAAAQITTNVAAHGFEVGDIALVCDFQNSMISQVTSVAASTIGFPAGGTAPGNNAPAGAMVNYRFGCYEGKTNGAACLTPATDVQWPAFVARLRGTFWYVGNHEHDLDGDDVADDTHPALYRASLGSNAAGEAEIETLQVIDYVDDLQVRYRVGPQYVTAAEVTANEWPLVSAVRIDLALRSPESVSPGGTPLVRRYRNTVAIRSRIE